MKEYDVFSAVVIQPELTMVKERKQLKQNLNRYLEILDTAVSCSTPTAAAPAELGKYESWAPVKLVCFPEFFLQGWTVKLDLKTQIKEMTIEIPGEETYALAKKAKEYGIYINGCALEYDSDWPDRILNCNFIIDPRGEIIHKYHKFVPAIHFELSLSPHDMYDMYVEKYGKGKSILQTFFPVTETEIGKLGTLTCMDGHYPEHWRALAMNGAEIILRHTSLEPMISPPMETWEVENRGGAWANTVYVVSANIGTHLSDEVVKFEHAGHSMIIDYNGVILALADYPGETMISSTICLDHLRRRRADPSRNFLTQLRTDVLREIYKEQIYPKNLFLKEPVQSFAEVYKRDARTLGIIDKFFEKGIFTKPRYLREK